MKGMVTYLVIKLGAIGDVAMASTMLTEIRNSGKETSITWVVGKAAAPLLAATGLVDEIILADERAILSGGLWQKILAASSISRVLSGRKFDVCLVPYRDFRYRLLLLGVRCSDVRTFRKSRGLVPGRYHGFEYARLARGHESSHGMGGLLFPLCVLRLQIQWCRRYCSHREEQAMLPTGCGNGLWNIMCALQACCAGTGTALG